jgi:hypothetical protein
MMSRFTILIAMLIVCATLRLEGRLHLYKIRSEAVEHLLDNMVRANAKNLVSNFSRQMPISQMPRKAHKLIGIFVPDFDNKLRSGPNLSPLPIFKLQAISIGHRNRFWKIEKDTFSLIRGQANAAAMARVKIESESARRLFLRPMSGRAMN